MKRTILLLVNLLTHPVKRVKGTALLTYRKPLLYVLGYLLTYLYLCLGSAAADRAAPYLTTLAAAAFVFGLEVVLTQVYYFIVLSIAAPNITYRAVRQIYLPITTVSIFFTVIYNILRFWIARLVLSPAFSLLDTLWFASITFLLCKYKFCLPVRRCRVIFCVILLLDIIWMLLSSLL